MSFKQNKPSHRGHICSELCAYFTMFKAPKGQRRNRGRACSYWDHKAGELTHKGRPCFHEEAWGNLTKTPPYEEITARYTRKGQEL